MTENKNIEKCPYFKKCGGCKYINLEYKEQLQIKKQNVCRILKNVCESRKIKVDEIVGSDAPLYYRNKVHSVFARVGGGKIIRGIYREDSHKVVDIKGCFLEDESADKIIEEVKRLLPSFKYKVYDEDSKTGWLRHVLVRVGHINNTAKTSDVKYNGSQNGKTNTAEVQYMLVLVTSAVPFPGKNNFVKAIRDKFPQITTIIQNINDKRTSMVLGDRNIICFGKGYIEDELLGLRFRISPNSFYQVNPAQTKKLYSKVIELADPKKTDVVIDAYCGTGTIGSCLAKCCGEVYGIELNPEAVKDAIFNAKQNNINNIRFIKDDATKWMVNYAANRRAQASDKIDKQKEIDTRNGISMQKEKYSTPDILIMDPPRSGSTPEFINAAAGLNIPKIVYVSCNPETLANDLKLFIKKGYTVKSITPFDMFPWTEHVECVVLLSM